MNCRQIFWLAALLTVEAAALSLLNTSHAQAKQVYRCDDTYQQLPCSGSTQAQSTLNAKDPRTPAQVAQSRQLGEQDLKAYRKLIRHRQHEIRMAPKAQAVALSSFRPGDSPFGHSTSTPSGSDSKPQRAHRRKNLRIAKVPQPRSEQQAAAQLP
jgi:hypothetical protein